jgi:hypothetical protein
MGKVASQSVCSGLNKVCKQAVIHAHVIGPNYPQGEVQELYRYLKSSNPPQKINLITLVRDPIARNISAFFQNLEEHLGEDPNQANLSPDDLRQCFLEKFPHEQPLTWMENSIEYNFGIDVYEKPFPEEGYTTFEKNGTRLLVMRCELSDEVKSRCVKEFLGLPEFEVSRVNVSSDKNYSELYREFKTHVRLPKEYVDRFCDSKMFRHFYSNEVIEETRKRWSES